MAVKKNQAKKPKKYSPLNPAEADLIRGAELVFDVTVDSLQKELVKLVMEYPK